MPRVGEYRPTGLVKVAELVVSTPDTSIGVLGLDLDADGPYKMILDLVNPTDGNVAYSLHFNDDDEPTHYWRQVVSFWHQGLTQARINDAVMVSVEAGESALVEATLARGPDGLVRCLMNITRRTPAEIVLMIHALAWTFPDNVTTIEVAGDHVAAIGEDSRLLLHKLGGER